MIRYFIPPTPLNIIILDLDHPSSLTRSFWIQSPDKFSIPPNFMSSTNLISIVSVSSSKLLMETFMSCVSWQPAARHWSISFSAPVGYSSLSMYQYIIYLILLVFSVNFFIIPIKLLQKALWKAFLKYWFTTPTTVPWKKVWTKVCLTWPNINKSETVGNHY